MIADSATWTNLDWNKTNTELAKENGVTNSAVQYWRSKVGHPSPNRYKHAKLTGQSDRVKQLILEIDFSKPDRDIALQYGFSRERARQLRKIAGARKVRRSRPKRTIFAEEQIKLHRKELAKMTPEEVIAKLGLTVCASTAEKIMRSNCVARPKKKPKWWDVANWNLSNELLASIWLQGIKVARVRAAQARMHEKKGPAKWDARAAKQPAPWIVESEREKARKWKESQ